HGRLDAARPAPQKTPMSDDDPVKLIDELTQEPAPPPDAPPPDAQPPVPAPEPVEEAVPPPQGESWVETIKTIVYALLIALVTRTFLFQPFNIPSGSMEATLLVGDYL